MNPLADLLSSKVKAELFRLLFGVPAARLHLRELARQSGLAVGTVRQELDRLARLGVTAGCDNLRGQKWRREAAVVR